MRIGVDVGGTKLEAAILDQGSRIVSRRRIPTPDGDYEAALAAIVNLVTAIEADFGGTHSVGLGIPGTISPVSGRIKNAYNSPFNGHAFDKDLEDRLGRPIRMMNDANCFALSEARDGAAAGADTVFGAIIGTGCGGGIVIDGKPLTGHNAIAGEWGHNPLPWPESGESPGLDCQCGRRGCIETFISGTGLTRQHAAATGRQMTAEEIVAAAESGDTDSEQSLARYETRLARGLAAVINLIDPDVIVLGGGMSNLARLYRTIPEMWSQWIFSDHVETRLLAPEYGDSSGVRGAAWLWPGEPGQ